LKALQHKIRIMAIWKGQKTRGGGGEEKVRGIFQEKEKIGGKE